MKEQMNHAPQKEGSIQPHFFGFHHEVILFIIITSEHKILHAHSLVLPSMEN